MGKKREVQVEEETAEIWVTSYADLMSLLACFFMMLVAFANFDEPSFSHKAEEVVKSLGITPQKVSDVKMKFMEQELARHPELLKKTKISVEDNILTITFSGTILFKDFDDQLSPEIISILDDMIDIIKSKNPDVRIIVEGHTDNRPMEKKSKYSSNWGLSAARAAAVIRRFEEFGFIPQNMRAVGFGDTKPMAPNQDKKGNPIPSNMELNNRATIKVIEPIAPVAPKKKIKLGLGVYFDTPEVERKGAETNIDASELQDQVLDREMIK